MKPHALEAVAKTETETEKTLTGSINEGADHGCRMGKEDIAWPETAAGTRHTTCVLACFCYILSLFNRFGKPLWPFPSCSLHPTPENGGLPRGLYGACLAERYTCRWACFLACGRQPL